MTNRVQCPICEREVDEEMLSLGYRTDEHAFCCPHWQEGLLENCEPGVFRSTTNSRWLGAESEPFRD